MLNTKVLFKYLPTDGALADPKQFLPAMAHMNYHPEKCLAEPQSLPRAPAADARLTGTS